jgi:prolipoprotein diacylglyceryltransferase
MKLLLIDVSALISPAGTVRSRTETTEFVLFLFLAALIRLQAEFLREDTVHNLGNLLFEHSYYKTEGCLICTICRDNEVASYSACDVRS